MTLGTMITSLPSPNVDAKRGSIWKVISDFVVGNFGMGIIKIQGMFRTKGRRLMDLDDLDATCTLNIFEWDTKMPGRFGVMLMNLQKSRCKRQECSKLLHRNMWRHILAFTTLMPTAK